ncbi:MAG: Carbonic anhydrase precursor [Methanomassiliicoccales archaeon PtaB.Bin134]|nr:MAG: Carbonic anhydrase precursor [Methanomassiliicoccales archaeon PtaB.Bin134]
MPERKIYVDPAAVIIGDVQLDEGVSIWPTAVLRGDANKVRIGADTNVQEGVVIHTSHDFPSVIGRMVTVGHGAVINGAVVGDRCIIGINSTILDGAVIGDECIIGANALVTSMTEIPPRSVVMGLPGKVVRHNDMSIREKAERSALSYAELKDQYLQGRFPRRLI